MIGPLAHLHLFYIPIICSINKSNNVLIDRMTSFTCYEIILIAINIQLHGRIAILSDCYKDAIYLKIVTASYVIYPEGGAMALWSGVAGEWWSGRVMERRRRVVGWANATGW